MFDHGFHLLVIIQAFQVPPTKRWSFPMIFSRKKKYKIAKFSNIFITKTSYTIFHCLMPF